MATLPRSIRDLTLSGRRVFLRVDFNVPIKDGVVKDDTRIIGGPPDDPARPREGGAARPRLAPRQGEGGARPEVLARPRREEARGAARRPGRLRRRLRRSAAAEAAAKALADGGVLLLENTRFHAGEEKNDPAFAKSLAALADVYVNDAFGTAHRAHASTAGMAVHFAPDARGVGLLMEKELKALAKVVDAIDRPFVGILGGAKILGKIAALEALVERADTLLVGGGMANHFVVALGLGIGKSLLEPEGVPIARKVIDRCKERGVNARPPVRLPRRPVARGGREGAASSR